MRCRALRKERFCGQRAWTSQENTPSQKQCWALTTLLSPRAAERGPSHHSSTHQLCLSPVACHLPSCPVELPNSFAGFCAQLGGFVPSALPGCGLGRDTQYGMLNPGTLVPSQPAPLGQVEAVPAQCRAQGWIMSPRKGLTTAAALCLALPPSLSLPLSPSPYLSIPPPLRLLRAGKLTP